MMHENLLGGPPETFLPAHEDAAAALAAAADPAEVAARFPAYCAAWAALAERALLAGDPVSAYAFARTGYHRGLDQLRQAGWKGHGPVPWEHEPTAASSAPCTCWAPPPRRSARTTKRSAAPTSWPTAARPPWPPCGPDQTPAPGHARRGTRPGSATCSNI